MLQNRRVLTYLLTEIIPAFLLGLVVFISILLMFQALRLTDLFISHGVKGYTLFRLLGYMSISFLPMLFPMSLLFAILLTYNRLSQDSELIALKSVGLNSFSLVFPALIFAMVVSFFSSQTSYYLAPWGNRQFELLVSKLSNTKAAASIKEGTFSEGFFDMVIYANKVDSKSGVLGDLFIYDERNPNAPLTIIAPNGEIIPDQTHPGHSVLLRLYKGQIHRKAETHTVINFDLHEVLLNDPIRFEERKKSVSSLSLHELNFLRNDKDLPGKERLNYSIEFHKRSALAFACIVFSIIGIGFGIITNRRSGKSSGFIVSVGFIVLYWILYIACESAARSELLPPYIAIWLTNFLLASVGLFKLRLVWD